jgi:hypothetical protein
MTFYESSTEVHPEVVLPHSNIKLAVGERFTMPVDVVPESARASLTITNAAEIPEASLSSDKSEIIIDAQEAEAHAAVLSVSITVDGVGYTDSCRVTFAEPEEDDSEG